MRLYKRKDFIKLESNTIFSKVIPDGDIFEGLYCKLSDDEFLNDWVEQNLLNELGFPNDIDCGMESHIYQFNLRDTFQDFEMDLDCGGRDGCFNDDDLFVVWDKKDVKKLADYLLSTL